MQTWVYRSSKKTDLYVYLAREDGLVDLPEPVLQQLGDPEFALSFDLTETRQLSCEDPVTVLHNLTTQGFHIQMPQDVESLLESLARPTDNT